jgi:osmotically-inducible protein OsmY
VTLSGTVPTHLARRAALSSAQAVPGVKNVKDELAVGAPEVTVPTDTEIRKMVESTLAWHPDIEIENLAVEVDSGRVTFSGRVRSSTARQVVQELATCTRGVKEVENNLVVDA